MTESTTQYFSILSKDAGSMFVRVQNGISKESSKPNQGSLHSLCKKQNLYLYQTELVELELFE